MSHSQTVSVGNYKSARSTIETGCHNVLFCSLYVKDLSTALPGCGIFQYADGTVFASRHLEYDQAVQLLSHDASKIMDWFDQKLIKINSWKPKQVCFRNLLKAVVITLPVLLHESSRLNCACSRLEYVDHVRYLGFFFLGSDMFWNWHLLHVCGKLRSAAASCSITMFLCIFQLGSLSDMRLATVY